MSIEFLFMLKGLPNDRVNRLLKNIIIGNLIAAQGCAASINDRKSLKVEERQNRVCLSELKKPMEGLFQHPDKYTCEEMK